MKKRYFIYCLLLVPILGMGQGFEVFFGTEYQDEGIRCFQIPNENAYLSISKLDSSNIEHGIAISKFDSLGNILWTKYKDVPIDLLDEKDFNLESDGFRLAVFRYDYFSTHSLEVHKFDFDGEQVDSFTYILPAFNDPARVRFLPDLSTLFIVQDYDALQVKIYKFSPDGNLIWEQYYPDYTFYNSNYKAVTTLSNDDFIVLSIDKSLQGSTPNATVSKFDDVGNLEWKTNLPFIHLNTGGILPFPDGDGYFVWASSGLGTQQIGKIDNSGQVMWTKYITSLTSFIGSYSVIPGDNNSFYMTGDKNSKIVLLEIGDDGEVLLEKQFDGPFNINASGWPLRTSDGGILIQAVTYPWPFSALQFGTDPFILKLNNLGDLEWTWYSTRPGAFENETMALTSDGGYLILGRVSEDDNGNVGVNSDFDNTLIKLTAKGTVYANHVFGKLTYDENLSCDYTDGEPLLVGWKIKETASQTNYTVTLADGSFWLHTNSDSITVNAVPPNTCWVDCPDAVPVSFNANDTVNVSLQAQPTKYCPVLVVDISSPWLRSCSPNYYHVYCKNTGTIAAENARLIVQLDSFLLFQNTTYPVFVQNGNELVFNLGNLGVNEVVEFTIYIVVSCDAELGQELCVTLIGSADNECNTTGRELAITQDCQPILGAYDPNDKRAFSQGTLTDRFIPADSIIEYQIRFQNTGTDTAFNVVVTDTLSSLLDIESIIAGASSNPYHMELERNNILKFVFKDIMLPDSNINEAASHGFVKFRIRHKPGLVPGDVIPNKAAIFFDFNEAVITNNLELEIESPVSAVKPPRQRPNSMLKVYPQPAGEVVVFELKSAIGQQPCRLEIMNMLGQKLYDQAIKEGANTVSNLPAGQHFYRLWQDGGALETGKVVVVK